MKLGKTITSYEEKRYFNKVALIVSILIQEDINYVSNCNQTVIVQGQAKVTEHFQRSVLIGLVVVTWTGSIFSHYHELDW